ncbi:MAG: enoyl-CoA hydratase/isomerase family protein [Bdellovibrionales bacterium]|nr:enoyl-CoA hydratase/isomerase family protein [Bdellovibrionales bacterium]
MTSLYIEASTPITIVRFEAPSIRNSFGLEQAIELNAILKQEPKAILFYSGLTNALCSGGNLKDYSQKTDSDCIKTNRKIRDSLKDLQQVNIPTLLVVDGDTLGGGIELLSCFDHVIAGPKSLFAFWQRKIALSYGWGGGERLLQRLSAQDLKQKSLSAEMFDAYEAKRIGLIDEVVSSHLLLEHGVSWLLRQLQLPQESFSTLKNFSTKTEVKKFEKLWGNPSHKKILSAFMKR